MLKILITIENSEIDIKNFTNDVLTLNEIYKLHKISYWKLTDENKLVGLIILQKKWGSIFPPKFSILNSKNNEIPYQIEKNSQVEF
jgi:hypothetical protein